MQKQQNKNVIQSDKMHAQLLYTRKQAKDPVNLLHALHQHWDTCRGILLDQRSSPDSQTQDLQNTQSMTNVYSHCM